MPETIKTSPETDVPVEQIVQAAAFIQDLVSYESPDSDVKFEHTRTPEPGSNPQTTEVLIAGRGVRVQASETCMTDSEALDPDHVFVSRTAFVDIPGMARAQITLRQVEDIQGISNVVVADYIDAQDKAQNSRGEMPTADGFENALSVLELAHGMLVK